MNKKIPLSGLLAAFALACLLGGCSGPSLVLSVASQPNVNPDHSGRPSPVLVTLYELRGELAFKQADFPSLFANPVQTLGADLVFMTELVFVPGEARRVEFQPHADARFVGVAAEFRQMERALWRMAKPMNPEKRNILALELNDVSLLAVPEEAAAKWSPTEAVERFSLRRQRERIAAEVPSGVRISEKTAPGGEGGDTAEGELTGEELEER